MVKFQGFKVLHFFSLFNIQKISCGILFCGGVSHPTNYIGVKGVKFHDFNPTMKLTKNTNHTVFWQKVYSKQYTQQNKQYTLKIFSLFIKFLIFNFTAWTVHWQLSILNMLHQQLSCLDCLWGEREGEGEQMREKG